MKRAEVVAQGECPSFNAQYQKEKNEEEEEEVAEEAPAEAAATS